MQFATYDKLCIEPYQLERILDLSIEANINQHTKAMITGRIAPEQKDEYAKTTDASTPIKISQKLDGKDKILFQGVVVCLEVQAVGDTYHLHVEALSYSYLLDIKKINRSWQNKEQTYDQLLAEVCAAYDEAHFVNVAAENAPIGQLILQIDETDMELAVRLSSWHNTGIVPEHTQDSPQLYFGVPQQREQVEIPMQEYAITKDIGRIRTAATNYIPGLNEQIVDYHVISDQALKIGQPVTFMEKTLYVRSIQSKMTEGLFRHHYVLTPADGLKQNRFYNQRLTGLSLMGRVIGVTRDKVKVHLDIDKTQDPATACWFPYSTMYTGHGTGWYCPPELNDIIRVYSPTEQESGAFAISAVSVESPAAAAGGGGNVSDASEGGGDDGDGGDGGSADKYSLDRDRLGDTSVKSIKTIYGKEIVFAPHSITIHGSSFSIVLHDDNGIDIYTDNNINMHAKKKINIVSEKIAVIGKQSISLTCEKGSQIKMDANLELSGAEVRSN